MQPIVVSLIKPLSDKFERMGYAVRGTTPLRIRNDQ